jgi:aminopeptidase YwaD
LNDNITLPQMGPQQVKEAFALTNEVVEGYPGRLAGSEACVKAGQRIKTEFEKFCDAGTVKAEQFDIHPQSVVKLIPVLVALYFACIVLLYFVPSLAWISFIGLALGLFAYYGQTMKYWHLVDALFPKKQGYNVYGSIEPSGEVKQQIILSAHHDAAYIAQLRAFAPKLFGPLKIIGSLVLVIAVLVSLAATIFLLFGIILPQWVGLTLLILGIFVLPFLFFTTNAISPAAGDDMMGVAIAAGVGKVFGDAKKAGSNPLRHTRLIIFTPDAEEVGLRGSQAWVKRHLAELKATKTYAFNMDPIFRLSELNFFDEELGGKVKLSREMAQECVNIAAALGYEAYIGHIRGGGASDATNYGKAGIEATNLHGRSSKKGAIPLKAYHTADDLSKNVEPELVEAALKIAREYILRKEKGSL